MHGDWTCMGTGHACVRAWSRHCVVLVPLLILLCVRAADVKEGCGWG